MANTTDKSILTAAGKALLAQLNAEEKPLIIDKMIFANVPNRPEFPQPDDVVPDDFIVHQEGVEQRGRLSVDSVIYSTTLTSDVGPFEFNWTGAYCSEYGVLVTVDHHALTPKTADEPGVAGNTLVRSVVLEYKDIAEITNITVDASTWQYNATERLKKMDTDVAQAIIDQNGKDWFIEDGFLVTPQASTFNIKAGAGYVSGNRVMLEFDRNVQVPNKPSFIYVDAHREGTPNGEQVTLFDIVVTAEEKDDYVDANEVKHFVCKIAQVLGDGSVSDLRQKSQSVENAKLFKENIHNVVRGDIDHWQFKVNVEAFAYDDPSMLKDFNDGTVAFERAIQFVRMLPNPMPIFAGGIQTTLSKRLFFGPKTSDDIITSDGELKNVCLGFIGLDNQSTIIKPSASLKGDVMFDLSGLRDKYLRDFQIKSDVEETAPGVGILTARLNIPDHDWGPTSNEWGDITRVIVGKYFSITPLLQASTEETLVERCRFRTDHKKAKAPCLLTTNMQWSVGDYVHPSDETELEFALGTQSNLHQRHVGNDYYYGAGNDSTESDVAMVLIHGCNQVRIESPFFNNNSRKVDCVRVRGDVPESLVNNIHVIGANCHKETRSGLRLIGGNKQCSWVDNTTTIGSSFTDAEIVVDGFTSSLFVPRCSSMIINHELIDSNILSCDSVDWLSSKKIVNTLLVVNLHFNQTDVSSVHNNFNLVYLGDYYLVQGRFDSLNQPAAKNIITSNKACSYKKQISNFEADVVESENEGLSKSIRDTIGPHVSTSNFLYEKYRRGNSVEAGIARGGFFVSGIDTGGMVQKGSDGKYYKLITPSGGGPAHWILFDEDLLLC